MTAEEVLRSNEESAAEENQIVYSGSGRSGKKSKLFGNPSERIGCF